MKEKQQWINEQTNLIKFFSLCLTHLFLQFTHWFFFYFATHFNTLIVLVNSRIARELKNKKEVHINLYSDYLLELDYLGRNYHAFYLHYGLSYEKTIRFSCNSKWLCRDLYSVFWHFIDVLVVDFHLRFNFYAFIIKKF